MSDDLILSKEAFLKAALPEETVEIPGLGTVRVRSLSRAEFMDVRELAAAEWEVMVVAYGLVEPALTADEVRDWRGTVPHRVYDDLAGEVLRVSGLKTKAVEEAKRTFPAQQ